MSGEAPIPVEIRLDRTQRVLELTYGDGTRHELSCEYLRVYSPSVEVRGLGELQVHKEDVNITDVKQLGSYAVRIFFDDGHRSGIYSWEHLYDLCIHHDQYWQDYLRRLETGGYRRKADDGDKAGGG